MTGLHFDESARRLAPFLVRPRHHGSKSYARMLEERILDLDRGYVLAARNDDVLRAVTQLNVAVGILDPEIAGMEPPAGEGFVGRRLVLQIAFHYDVAPEHHFAHRISIGRHSRHRLGVEHVERLDRLVA